MAQMIIGMPSAATQQSQFWTRSGKKDNVRLMARYKESRDLCVLFSVTTSNAERKTCERGHPPLKAVGPRRYPWTCWHEQAEREDLELRHYQHCCRPLFLPAVTQQSLPNAPHGGLGALYNFVDPRIGLCEE